MNVVPPDSHVSGKSGYLSLVFNKQKLVSMQTLLINHRGNFGTASPVYPLGEAPAILQLHLVYVHLALGDPTDWSSF
jgi:hypothetical protein